MGLAITAEPTPNPNAVKLTANEQIFEGTKSISANNGEETDHPLLNLLLNINGIENVFGFQNFITVNKKPDADWDTLMPEIEQAFDSYSE